MLSKQVSVVCEEVRKVRSTQVTQMKGVSFRHCYLRGGVIAFICYLRGGVIVFICYLSGAAFEILA